MNTTETLILDPALAEFIDAHDRALERGDAAWLEDVIADEYLMVSPLGKIIGRAGYFEWFGPITKYDVMKRKIITARQIGSNWVVVSDCTPIMRVRGGEPSEHQAFMLEIWTQAGGAWKKAVEQYTRPPVSVDAPAQ